MAFDLNNIILPTETPVHYVPYGNECLFCGHTFIWMTDLRGADLTYFTTTRSIAIYESWIKKKYKPCKIQDYAGYLKRLEKLFK